MMFQTSVMTNDRTASHFRRERSRSLSFISHTIHLWSLITIGPCLAYLSTMTGVWGLVQFHGIFWCFLRLQRTPWLLLSYSTHRNKEMNPLLLWLWWQAEITYFWISKTSCPIIRTQMTFEISLTFVLPSQNWINRYRQLSFKMWRVECRFPWRHCRYL